MLPGLWPTLLLARSVPFRNVVMQTNPWVGSAGAYFSDVSVSFEGGVGPFTYAWSIDNGLGDATLDNPAAQATTARAGSNVVANVFCLITDATGQTYQAGGTIQAI